ncbi:MAG: hypothetical protein QMB79_01995, partial [Cloacibacterium sp.]
MKNLKIFKDKREVSASLFYLGSNFLVPLPLFCFASLHKKSSAQLGLQFGYHLENFCNFFCTF